MSHLLNKLLGRDNESETHSKSNNSEVTTETNISSTNGQRKHSSGGHVMEGHTVQHEGVNIKSTISSDASSTVSMANQQKLTDLISKLGSTHTQIDHYAKKQTEKINEEIQREIDEVVARTRNEQHELLCKANHHTAQIDSEYRAQLQKMVEEADAVKAKRITEIEKLLNDQQTGILQSAKCEIDQLNQKAANMKIGILQQTQAKLAADANEITAQAVQLGQTSTVHQSKGTTTIKTEVTAATKTKEIADTTGTAANQTCDCAGGAQTSSSSGKK